MSRDRAVSTVLGYVVALGITSILITGLLVTAGTVVDRREDATTRDALQVVGQRIASNLMAADRLATTDPARAEVEVSLPARLSGTGYAVRVNGSASRLVLTADDADATATVAFAAETPVADAVVRGGDLRVVLTPADRLEVRSS